MQESITASTCVGPVMDNCFPAFLPGSNSCDAIRAGYALDRTAMYQVSGATSKSLKGTGKSKSAAACGRVSLYRACILYRNSAQVLFARPLSRFLILSRNEVPNLLDRLVLKFIATFCVTYWDFFLNIIILWKPFPPCLVFINSLLFYRIFFYCSNFLSVYVAWKLVLAFPRCIGNPRT